jgi:hypothetical protein
MPSIRTIVCIIIVLRRWECMVNVNGKIHYNGRSMDYDIELPYESITETAMPIPESTKLIIDEINRKYKENFPYSSFLNPVNTK